jgi:hypothetical protein
LNDNEVLLVSGENLLGSTDRFYLTWDEPLKGQRLIEYRDGTTWFSSVDFSSEKWSWFSSVDHTPCR